MARQILDLRTQAQRQGITGLQQSMQAISGILQTLGEAEKVRRERQILDRITRAIGAGATDIEAIAAAAGQGPEFGTGFQGILQKMGGAFQPQGGGIGQGIQKMIIGERLKQALAPKAPKIPSGLEPTGVTVGPKGGVTQRFAPKAAKVPKKIRLDIYTKSGAKFPKQFTEDETFDAQIADVLSKGHTFAPPEEAPKWTEPQRIQKDDPRGWPEGTIIYTNKETGEIDVLHRPEVPKKTFLQERIDEGYAREEAQLITDIKYGLKPRASSRKHYDNMSNVEKMKFLTTLKRSAEGPYYGIEGGNKEPLEPKVAEWANKELQKLPMFQEAPTEDLDLRGMLPPEMRTDFKGSARVQSAPDVRLDPHWDKLSMKQKEDIWTQFEQDPNSIDRILEIIQGATP